MRRGGRRYRAARRGEFEDERQRGAAARSTSCSSRTDQALADIHGLNPPPPAITPRYADLIARSVRQYAEWADGSQDRFNEMRILIVDDDNSLAEMYRLQLAAAGHDVGIAVTGDAGFKVALIYPPDLLLLDIRLPGIDGMTLLAELRHHLGSAELPVVVLSNYDEVDVVQRGTELGVLAHLVKSRTTPAALIDIINTLLHRPAAE